jgi:GrpB-like predicted nucleotidyltransferase (UPF0157 family)
MSEVVIARPDESWPAQYEKTAHAVGALLGELAQRIDHIGSTSVPRLPAKDVIDVQVTVGTEPELDDVAERMVAADWELRPARRDHPVPGLPADDVQWVKRMLVEPMYRRRVNLHVRVAGHANQRYALLFRDYLRNHADAAQAYALFKQKAAALRLDAVDYTSRTRSAI